MKAVPYGAAFFGDSGQAAVEFMFLVKFLSGKYGNII